MTLRPLKISAFMAAMTAALLLAFASSAKAGVARSTTTSRPSASGGSGNFGLGVMLGDPTGLSAKYWMSGNSALQFGLAYSWDHYGELLVDYLWHFPNAFGKGGSQFVPYVGIGGMLLVSTGYDHYDEAYWNGRWWVYDHDHHHSDVAFGLRIPLGIEFLPRGAPLGVFAELAPAVRVIPGIDGIIQAALGVRIYL